jgi:hypothetical protein
VTYTPNNQAVFLAAFVGACSGIAADGRNLTLQDPDDYAASTQVAGAFAQSFDTEWGTAVATSTDALAVQQICAGHWSGRFANAEEPFLTPSTYRSSCLALIALVQESSVYLSGQDINPVVPNMASVSTLAALRALPDTALPAGSQVWVSSVGALYTLNKTSTATLLGTEIVATQSAVGRWKRILTSSDSRWASVADWYIDPATGDDENEGTALAPLATPDEIYMRLYEQRITAATLTLWVVSSVATTKVARLRIRESVGIVYVKGTRTVTRTGTLTGATGLVGNVAQNITDAAVPGGTWTPDVNKLFVPTSLSTRSSVIESDMGGQTARISPPVGYTLSTAGYSVAMSATAAPYTVGTTYEIQSIPTMALGSFEILPEGQSSATQTRLIIEALRIPFEAIGGPAPHNSYLTWFRDCIFENVPQCDAADYINCVALSGYSMRGQRPSTVGGISRSTIDINSAAPTLQGTMVIGGAGIFCSSGANATLAACLVYSSGADGVTARNNGRFTMSTNFGNGLWGSGNVTHGIHVKSGSQFIRQTSNTIAITGTVGDIKIETASSCRSTDTTTNAVTNLNVCSYANLAAATPGGFGGTIRDILSGAQVLIG